MTQINARVIGQATNTCATNNSLNQNNSNKCKSSITLKCGSLNVCGIRRKMQYPEFRDLISNYDLFCVTESKLDNHDLITLPGYKFISQPRRQKFLRRSGGIGVFVKDNISPHISIIDSDSDYILW